MASWYLDSSATGSASGTSWTNAWTAFSSVVWGSAGVDAGDTLYISGGSTSKTYAGSQFTVGASGASDNVLTISISSTTGHNGTVIFDGQDSVAIGIYCYRNYVTIHGGAYQLKLTGYTSRVVRSEGMAGVVLDGLWMDDSSAEACVRFVNNTSCTIQNCKMTTASNRAGTTDGLFIYTNTNITIDNNWIGIYNEAESYHNDCVQLYGCTGATIKNNYCEQVNSKITNAQGIYCEECSGEMCIYNNVVYNPNGNDSVAIRNYSVGTATLRMYNNTLIGGGYILLWTTMCPNPIVQNNVFYYTGSSGYAVNMTSWSGTAGNIDYNCVYAASQVTPITLNGTALTWASWQALGFDTNGLNSDPGLSSDYQSLNVSSAIIDSGVTLPSPYNVDRNGIPRPQSLAFDMGAYEYIFPGPHRNRMRFF